MTDGRPTDWPGGLDLAALVWSSASAIAAVMDATGILVGANATFQRHAGRAPVGESILAFAGEGQVDAFWGWLSSPGDGWTARIWGLFPDEHLIPRDFRLSACRDGNGTIVLVGEPIAQNDLNSGLLDVNSSLVEEQRRLGKDRQRLDKISQEDALTGVANRRAFDAQLDRASTRATDKHGFSVVMLDIDHFKSVNDRYGHPAGDAVLRWLGGILRAASRRGDFVARYGGEEFVAILSGANSADGASWAERLRTAVRAEQAPMVDETVTVSIGVSTWRPGDSGSDVVTRADNALYEAKRSGRDRVMVEAETG